jgi:hypothetical protein
MTSLAINVLAERTLEFVLPSGEALLRGCVTYYPTIYDVVKISLNNSLNPAVLTK